MIAAGLNPKNSNKVPISMNMSSIQPNKGMKSGKKSQGEMTYIMPAKGIIFSLQGTLRSNNNLMISVNIFLIKICPLRISELMFVVVLY